MQAPKLSKSRQTANDLRRSHFTLGAADPKSRVSEYVQEYQGKKGALEASQKDKLNVRASHFQFGPHEPSKTFYTISQKDYKEHTGFQAPKLNEEKKRDLRSSHFTLGSWNPAYASLNHVNFPEKHIPMNLHKQEQEVQRSKMRKHNHDFTETQRKMFSSEYNNNFNKANDPNSLKQALTGQEIRQKVIDLRKSHVILGEDYRAMTSIAQGDYTSKQGSFVPPSNDNVNIRRTNFQLGVNKDDFASSYQESFIRHPLSQRANLHESLGKELRSTHFSFGQDAPLYASNSSASFRGPPTSFKPTQSLNPNLQKNHFSLGDPNEGLQNKTTYSNYHQKFENAGTALARDQNADRGSHFKLGGHNQGWASEAQAHYKSHDGAKAADLDGALKADLRSSHFKFNDVKPQYTTIQKASFVPKQGEPNKLDEGLKKDLQTSHFNYGGDNVKWATSSGLAFRATNGKASSLNPQMAKDLRANHFATGNGQWQQHTSTEYRSNFFWKNDNEVTA